MGRGQILAAFAFGCAYFLWTNGAIVQFARQHSDFGNRPYLLGVTFVTCQLAAFVLLACVSVAERLAGQVTRQAAIIAAIVVSAIIVGPLKTITRASAYALGAPGAAQASEKERRQDLFDALREGFFQWLVLGGGAAFVYVDRRRAQRARARLHVAELERAYASKRTLESRLQAMQARVEPQFLFNTLAQVQELYRTDAARGERMLDELIAYLRAAMPKMRDTSSTLGQEIELARAYLAIEKVRLGDRLTFSIDTQEADRPARMPPMMLLPLVDHAIGRPLEESNAARILAIRADVRGNALTIEVACTGLCAGAFEDTGIAGIRERLAALYGSTASLELDRRGAQAVRAVVTIPVEAAA